MKTRLWLFFFVLFLAVLIVPALCQASTVVLTRTSPNYTITAGSDVRVYGTSASNQIILASGSKAELLNFPGQNAIQVQSSSDLFNISRSGTVVTFTGSDGTSLKIPATTDAQTISFNGEDSRVFQIHNNQVMLDDQIITATPASIEGNQDERDTCGAYVAPGVWKEFDCYNLAAMGKTTDADPFTPSWELNGGYWQWGRKGPDPSQWYDTNTEHFAHGPTDPIDSGANSASISGWASDAPDGAWLDSSKTANDPCPAGYRVPTKAQWQGVVDNNTRSTVGTWSTTWNDHTNYSSAEFFGDDLMLPAAGYRDGNLGSMSYRGYAGYYWSGSESEYGNYSAWYLFFDIGGSDTKDRSRRSGLSVRCVAEDTAGQPSIVTGPEVNILNTTISSQGASMAIAGTGTALDGSELTVAEGAFPDGATVSLKYAEITSHKLGNKVDPVMGLIRVKVGGGYAAELTSLKIPVTVTGGRYVMGFYVDEATGELSAVPSVYENGYVHLLAQRFGTPGTVSAETVSAYKSSARLKAQGPWESASIIISAFSVNAMLAMDADSAFRPAVDDWEFPNTGAYNSPGGICTGMIMTAMYYYYTQKSTQGRLFRKYDSLETLWQDNPLGYRWAAQTQEDHKKFNSNELFYKHYILFAQSDLAQYLVLANAIYVTGQPQSLGIYADFGGHALIAYRAHNRKIYVADPNWPADEGRTITLKADNTFEPYDGQFQQGGSSSKFPYIYFSAKDADIDWQLLETGWREFTAGTAGKAVMPEYQLHLDGAKIENTCISRTNPARLGIESNQAAGEDLGFHIYDSKGTFLDTGYEAELNLDEGTNIFGIHVLGLVASSNTWEYVDFRWITVTYEPEDEGPIEIIHTVDFGMGTDYEGETYRDESQVFTYEINLSISNQADLTYNINEVEFEMWITAPWDKDIVIDGVMLSSIIPSVGRKTYNDGGYRTYTYSNPEYAILVPGGQQWLPGNRFSFTDHGDSSFFGETVCVYYDFKVQKCTAAGSCSVEIENKAQQKCFDLYIQR